MHVYAIVDESVKAVFYYSNLLLGEGKGVCIQVSAKQEIKHKWFTLKEKSGANLLMPCELGKFWVKYWIFCIF